MHLVPGEVLLMPSIGVASRSSRMTLADWTSWIDALVLMMLLRPQGLMPGRPTVKREATVRRITREPASPPSVQRST